MAKPAKNKTTGDATATGNGDTAAPAAAKRGPNGPRIAPILTEARSDIPMPSIGGSRGSKSIYSFAALTAVGMSFGVKNKTAKSLSSIISNQNRKPGPVKTDPATGLPVMKMVELRDANNNVVGTQPGTEPDHLPGKKFVAYDVDAANDPEGASVRVWRTA